MSLPDFLIEQRDPNAWPLLAAMNHYLGQVASHQPEMVDTMISHIEMLHTTVSNCIYAVAITLDLNIDGIRANTAHLGLRSEIAAVLVASSYMMIPNVGMRYYHTVAAIKVETIRTLRALLGVKNSEPN